MSVEIPFVRDIDFDYGAIDQVSPLIRRIVARNPSPFTYTGTGTYIIGKGQVAVIDPGPLVDGHVDALMTALKGETVSHILITHTHLDHSPAAAPLKAATGAMTYGYGPHGQGKLETGVVIEEGGDQDFKPDVTVRHGDMIEGNGWIIDCVYTPGHTSNHMCFGLRDERALFTGDHVMGWSTSVIGPPDGDMTAYLNSLKLLLTRDDEIFWPTHGPPVRDPRPFVEAFIAHREEREAQITACLARGIGTIKDMVTTMYAGIDTRLHPAAALSVYAHLIHMIAMGRVVSEGDATLEAVYRSSS